MKKNILLFLLVLFFFNDTIAEEIIEQTNRQNQTQKNQSQTNYYQSYNSIMFSNENIKDISATFPRFYYLLNNKGKIASEDEVKQTLDTENISKSRENLVNLEDTNIYIYLNSIMYISKNAWSVWINDSKITNENNENRDIIIKKITPNYINIVWSFDLSRWDIVNPNKIIPEDMYKIKDNIVSIFLKISPNQTYIVRDNKILEGRPEFLKKIKKEEKPVLKKDNNKKENNKNIFENLFL